MLMILALVVGACGDDDAETGSTTTAASSGTTVAGTAAPGTTAADTAATTTPPETGPTGTLRVSVSSFGAESIDPSMERLVSVGLFGMPIYDWLIWPGPNGEIPSPGVAVAWEVSDDNLSWTVTLRDDMIFHNGDALTAEDVKFSIERHLREEATSSLSGVWRANVDSIDVLSPTELRINLKGPWPVFPLAATPFEGAQASVQPKAYFESVGEDGVREAAVGSGPWEFVEHNEGTSFVFKASDTPHPYRPQPGFAELEILLVPEASTRLAQLKAGEVQIAEISPSQIKEAQDAGLQILEIPNFTHTSVSFFGFGPNAEGMPIADVNVRKALSLAINRPELIATILGGFGEEAARFIVGPGTLGFDPSWELDPYDPAAATQLLADAGFGGGFTVRFYSAPVGGVSWIPEAIQAIAGYWQAIGVDTEIIPTDYGTLSAAYREHPIPELLAGAAMINIAQVTQTNLTLANAYYPSSSVVWMLPDATMDDLMAQATAATTIDELGTRLTAATDYAHEQYVTYPLAITPSLFAATADVTGWDPFASGYIGMLFEALRPAG